MILLILGKKEAHGYEILQELSKSFSGVWEPKSGTIYPALNSLEERGFLESRKVEQEDKPDKKIYEITDEGREVLEEVFESFEEEVEYSEDFGAIILDYIGRKFGSHFFKRFLREDMREIKREKMRKLKRKLKENHWKHRRGPWIPWMKYLCFGNFLPEDDRKEMLKRYKARLQEELDRIKEELEKMEGR